MLHVRELVLESSVAITAFGMHIQATSWLIAHCNRDGSKKKKAKGPKADAYLKQVPDRKLKGQLKHTERLYKESNQVAARVNTWLAPADAGFLETEGTGLQPRRLCKVAPEGHAAALCLMLCLCAAS
jgi:hypothetical protein